MDYVGLLKLCLYSGVLLSFLGCLWKLYSMGKKAGIVIGEANEKRAWEKKYSELADKLLGDGGDDQFAFAVALDRFERCRVDDFRIEMVLEDVQAVLGFALAGDAGADDFGEAVDVIRLDAGTLLDFSAHLLGPWLGAEDAFLEFRLAEVDAHLSGDLDQV